APPATEPTMSWRRPRQSRPPTAQTRVVSLHSRLCAEPGSRHAAAVQQRSRRHACESLKVTIEVCLIEVPAGQGDIGERRDLATGKRVNGTPEANHAGKSLRSETALAAERRREMPFSTPQLVTKGGDPKAPCAAW